MTAAVNKLSDLLKEIDTYGRQAGRLAVSARRAMKDVGDRWDLNAESKKRGVDLEWEKAQAEIGNIERKYRAAREEYAAKVRELTSPHKLKGGAEAEMLRQAAWNRLQRHLDALPSDAVKVSAALQLLQAAQADGDVHMIDVSRRELGPYLVAKGESLPGQLSAWLDVNGSDEDAALARIHADTSSDDLMRAEIAVGRLARGVAKREIPDVMASMDEGQVIYTDPDRDAR